MGYNKEHIVKRTTDKSEMNTYFCLLDMASLFQVLLRIHYPDLLNLIEARPYLKKLIHNGKHFQHEWNRYNLHLEIIKQDNTWIRQIDRLRKKHGHCIVRNDRFILSDTQYIQDVIHGIEYKYYDMTGLKRSTVNYKNNKRHGLATYYNADGTLHQQYDYIDDVVNGYVIKYFYGTNVVYEKAQYINGKRQGPCLTYWPDGTLKKDESYDSWNLEGTYKHYDQHGALIKTGSY